MRLLRDLTREVARARGGGFGILQTLFTQGAVMVVNIVTGVLTARLLGPVGRGEFAAASLWLLLPALMATVGLQNGIVYESRRRPARAAVVGKLGLLVTTALYLPVAAASLWALPRLMHGYSGQAVNLARFAVGVALLNVWMQVARQSLLGTRNMHLFNLSNYASPFLYLILLLGLAAMGGMTPATVLLAQTAATIAVLAVTWRQTVRGWGSRRLSLWRGARPLLGYSLKAAAIDLVVVGYYNVDRLVLVGLITPAEFGYYAVAASLARLMGVLQTAVSSVTLADLSHKPAAEIERFIHRAFRLLLWALVLACLGGWALGGVLLRLVYGASYGGAVPVFRVLIVDASVACLAQMQLEAFLAAGKPSFPSLVQGISFAVILSAMALLAPPFGAMGAACALLCGSGVKLALLLGGLRRIGLRLPNPLPNRDDIGFLCARLRRGSASA